MNQKNKIIKMLSEVDDKKHVVMSSDKYKDMGDDLGDDTIVKIVDENEGDNNVNVVKLQSDVQKFMDKLNLSQFEQTLGKIDKPIEQAELIAAFAERIGVPRSKLNSILSSLKEIGNGEVQEENSDRPKMKKKEINHEPTDSRGIDPMHPNRRKMKKKEIPQGNYGNSTRPKMKKKDLVEHILKTKK